MKQGKIKGWLGLLFMALVLFLPIGTLRPNRILPGTTFHLYSLLKEPMAWAFVVLGLILMAFLWSLVIKGGKYTPALDVFPWILTLLPASLLTAIAKYETIEVVYDPEVVRISLSSGFWLGLMGTILILSTGKRKGFLFLLTFLFLLVPPLLGWTPHLALLKEFLIIKPTFFMELQRHLVLALVSVLLAILPGILLGYGCYRFQRGREWILATVNFFQVAPTLSLLALVMIPLTLLSQAYPVLADWGIRGIGFAPAFIVLFCYCLLPITANTYAGFDQVEQEVTESAVAMGMKSNQVFWKVLFPLAFPVILSGVRTAVTQNLGNTILAGLIGGGGMGALIFLGLSQSASDLVILGTLPVVLFALIADEFLRRIEITAHYKMGGTYDSAHQRV